MSEAKSERRKLRTLVQLSEKASVRGRLEQADEVTAVPVSVFRGIPYAQPPVADLRFRPTQSLELWDGERDCSEYGAICPQPFAPSPTFEDIKRSLPPITNVVTSEDCLFLNIWTPTLDENARLPVMVWIHGGSFLCGSGDSYNGSAVAGMNNVLYVSINYRVGIFGFLTTGDDVAAGNYGLLDQVEALKWIQIHIRAFGGDPSNVTLFGQSAGGMSSSLHILSDLSDGLFHKVICQSGVANSTFVARTQAQERQALQAGLTKLGYDGGTSEDLLKFLQSKSPSELLSAFDHLLKVVIDGVFLKDYPHNLLRTCSRSVPVINGHTTHEANAMVKLCKSPNLVGEPEQMDQMRGFVKQVAAYGYSENLEAITDAMMEVYVSRDCESKPGGLYAPIIELCSDLTFNAPAHQFSASQCEKAPVYMYILSHRPSYTELPDWMVSDHSDDTAYSLGFPFLAPPNAPRVNYTEEEKQLSKLFMKYWTNFAKYGNPNSEDVAEWPRYTNPDRQYLRLQPKPDIGKGYKSLKMQFWEDTIPKLDTSRVYKT